MADDDLPSLSHTGHHREVNVIPRHPDNNDPYQPDDHLVPHHPDGDAGYLQQPLTIECIQYMFICIQDLQYSTCAYSDFTRSHASEQSQFYKLAKQVPRHCKIHNLSA